MSACTPLFDKSEVQYSHSKQRELNEIKKAYSTFDTMKDVDVALHIKKSDLSSLINKSFEHFTTNFAELNAGEFSNVSLGQLKLHLYAQQMLSELKFTFQVDALKRKIYGHIRAKHNFYVGRDEFVLSTNFDEIVIDRIENNTALEQSEESRHLISSSVKSFMNTLNMEIHNSPLTIPVDLNILKDINGKDIVSSSDYKLHSAKPVNMLTKMKVYMPYVYEDGVIFLGASELKKSEKTVKSDAADLWTDFNNKIDLQLDRSLGMSLESLQERTSYYVSRSYLSKQMNFALKNTDLRSINKSFLKIKDKDKVFSKDVFFSDEYRLPSCKDVQQDCSKTSQKCERKCTANYGMHKCEDCTMLNNPFEKERCISKQESCKTREELNLYECNKNEKKCRLENDNLRISCEIENKSLVAQCKEKKEKLLFVNDEIVLARLDLGLDIVNSYAVQSIHTIDFNQDLDSLEVIRDVHISMDTRLNIDMTNNSNSDLKCSMKTQEPLFTHSQSDFTELKRKLPLVTQTLPDGYMMIKAISKPYVMNVQLKHTPYERFLSNDDLVFSCSFKDIPMPSVTKQMFLKANEIPSALNAVLGKIELKFEPEELSFIISPVKLETGIALFPRMESKAIGFGK
ncbi:hypothetical protein ACFLR3_02365 [Campylobacterota bacterium]